MGNKEEGARKGRKDHIPPGKDVAKQQRAGAGASHHLLDVQPRPGCFWSLLNGPEWLAVLNPGPFEADRTPATAMPLPAPMPSRTRLLLWSRDPALRGSRGGPGMLDTGQNIPLNGGRLARFSDHLK